MLGLWMTVGLLGCALAQVVVGNAGVPLCLVPPAAFYFATTFDTERAAGPALLVGAVLDALYMHATLPCTLAVAVGLLLSRFWRSHGNCRVVPAQAIPGAALGLADAIIRLLTTLGATGSLVSPDTRRVLWQVPMLAVTGAMLLPVLLIAFDRFADSLGLKRFVDAREQAYP